MSGTSTHSLYKGRVVLFIFLNIYTEILEVNLFALPTDCSMEIYLYIYSMYHISPKVKQIDCTQCL